jgi:hypothetical protein
MTSEPSKVNGQINSIVGQGKELLGNAIEAGYSAVGGSSEPSQFTVDGKEQHAKGEAEIKAGTLNSCFNLTKEGSREGETGVG